MGLWSRLKMCFVLMEQSSLRRLHLLPGRRHYHASFTLYGVLVSVGVPMRSDTQRSLWPRLAMVLFCPLVLIAFNLLILQCSRYRN